LQNDLAKQKINLARLVGLPASDRHALSEDIPFSAAPSIVLEEALKQALMKRGPKSGRSADAGRSARAIGSPRRIPSLVFRQRRLWRYRN
jgi:hypothetical protein